MPKFSVTPGAPADSPGLLPPRKRGVTNRIELAMYAETIALPVQPRTRAAHARTASSFASNVRSVPAAPPFDSVETSGGVPRAGSHADKTLQEAEEDRQEDGMRVVVGRRGAEGVIWI